jgi:hypothetical protein
MLSSDLTREQNEAQRAARRFAVVWRNTARRRIWPVAVLDYDGQTYRFEYLATASDPMITWLISSPSYSIHAVLAEPGGHRYFEPGQTPLEPLLTPWRHPVRAGQMRATRPARAAGKRATNRAPRPSLARQRS